MNSLIIATNNPNKVAEISAILHGYEVLSLRDINFDIDIPETGSTLFENALIKAKEIYKRTGTACIADDTGLEVLALRGAPGVRSARYAGDNASSSDNINRLLTEMEGVSDRTARFRTVIAYMNNDGQYRFFEGEVYGEITHESRGEGGFGYDPVFIPQGYDQTFAEMEPGLKNKISHRGRALADFEDYFKLLPAL